MVEFSKDDKRVLLVGMEHYASKKFFTSVDHEMKTWIAEGKTETTILTELFTCSGPSTGIKPAAGLTGPQLLALSQSFNGGLPEAKKLTRNQTAFIPCVLDVDGKTYRPEYIVRRNREACEATSRSGDACHWAMDYPKGAGIEIQSGDLQLDRLAPAAQVLASLGYSNVSMKDGETGENTRGGIHNWFSMDYRNFILVNETKRALQKSHRAILPWGSGHVTGVAKLLIAEGFNQSESNAIRLGNSKDADLSKEMRQRLETIALNKELIKTSCQEKPESAELTPMKQVTDATR